jgi:hypothetical protein
MEIVVTLTVLFVEIWIFRWIINRLPVLKESTKGWGRNNKNIQKD